ncbi:MAG: hypothetical protein IKV89_00980 [Clostridia bacterium]|nr:hypothetical protein [Clostridia bacterium]
MKFVFNLVFWMIVVIVCLPILAYAPVPFLIFTICFLAVGVGLGVFIYMVDIRKGE